MAQGLRAFRKIEIGDESSAPGTAAAGDELIVGNLTAYFDDLTVEYPDEERASLARHMADDYITRELAPLSFEGDLNSRHIIWWLGMSVRGNITPTQPDSTNQPNAYLWTYEPGLATANTPDIANGIDTCTIEFGDNVQAYEVEYLVLTNLTIRGEEGGPCKVIWTGFGRQMTDTTFTGTAINTTFQRIMFQKMNFSMDTSWAALGSADKTGVLKGFEWSLDTMFAPVFCGDGNLYFAGISEDKKAPRLTLKYRWDSTFADGERTKYEARTTIFPELELIGNTVLDTGQANPPYVEIGGAYRYTDWPSAPTVEQGEEIVEVTAEGVYDATGAKMMTIAVLTDLSAYP